MRQLKDLCRDDKTALDAIDRATVGEHENQYTKPQVQDNNIMVQQGTSNTYALRKLRKDRPDLHERVLADELTPHGPDQVQKTAPQVLHPEASPQTKGPNCEHEEVYRVRLRLAPVR